MEKEKTLSDLVSADETTPVPPAEHTISQEKYDAVVAQLEQAKQAYSDLAEAFNKLLKEYNEMHVAKLFTKEK